MRMGIVVAAAVALLAWSATAQAPQPPALPPAQGSAQGSAQDQAAPPPAQPGPVAPGYRPGFIDAFGRWMQESTSGFNANLNTAWGTLPGKGMTDAASNAAKNTADVAKGAAEATQGAASAMGNAARDTAGALSRLPTARIVVGRERCTIAPNGAPDCRVAAEALCKANGYATGSSVDFETAEECPSGALMARWRGEPATCTTENYVTRSLCQ